MQEYTLLLLYIILATAELGGKFGRIRAKVTKLSENEKSEDQRNAERAIAIDASQTINNVILYAIAKKVLNKAELEFTIDTWKQIIVPELTKKYNKELCETVVNNIGQHTIQLISEVGNNEKMSKM